jgi:prophage tail gpP-like protein
MIIRAKNTNTPITKFTSFRIVTSITNIADSVMFSTRLFEELTIGTSVDILLDENTPLFPAKLDRVSPSGNFGRWQARSTTSILVDSCPIVSTGEFKNLSTKQIIQRIASAFGVQVYGEDGIVFGKYNIELDSTCDVIIAELCIVSGLIANTNVDGSLTLVKYSADTSIDPAFQLQEGMNCSMQFVADHRRVANEYVMLGQQSFLLDNNPTNAKHTIAGSYVGTKRATFVSPISTNGTTIKDQLIWHTNTWEATAETLLAKIPGIRLIEKGQMVLVNSSPARIENGKRLIETVQYVQMEDGQAYTELTLVLPSKYGGEEVERSGWIA